MKKIKTYPRLTKFIASHLYKPAELLSEKDKLLEVKKHIAIYQGVYPGSAEFVYTVRWYRRVILQAFAKRHMVLNNNAN